MKHYHFHIGLFYFFVLLAIAVMIGYGVGITLDRYFVLLIVPAIFLHKFRNFIHDFLPFILILLGFEFLRGVADNINPTVHYIEPITITKFMFFGHIPTIELQHTLYTPSFLHWYDYVTSFFYLLHFVIPLTFAFLLWVKSRHQFREFMLGLSILSYLAFLTYLIYPTAPPWFASQQGLLPPITKILNVVLANFPDKLHLPTVYKLLSHNVVAAIPSMHAAYPFIIYLYTKKFYKSWTLFSLIYAILMWFTIVYLGEHYFIDAIFGIIYSFVAFLLTHILVNRFKTLVNYS